LHKNATKCNETQGKWCKKKHGASKIIDTFETYHGPPEGEVIARGLIEPEAAAPRAARVFLFLLPGGRPRRRGGEEVVATVGTSLLPLFLGWPGPRLLGALSPPRARATPVAAVGVTAVAATAPRAAKVFLLRLPFRRPHFRGTGGAISGASVLLPLPSPSAAEPLREDMARQSLEEGQRNGSAPLTASALSF
jgi:hypothetical protein